MKKTSKNRPEFWSRHNTQVNDIERNDDDEVEFQVGGIAVKAVVNHRDIGSGNQDADSAVVEGLEDIGHDEIAAVKEMIDGASPKTADGAAHKHDDRPSRHVTDHLVVHLLQVSRQHLGHRRRLLHEDVARPHGRAEIVVQRLHRCDDLGHHFRCQTRHIRRLIPREEGMHSFFQRIHGRGVVFVGKIIEKGRKLLCNTFVSRSDFHASCIHHITLGNDICQILGRTLCNRVCFCNITSEGK